jgi:hypothetical protein
MATRNLVLRTMYIDPEVDDELRTEAFDSRTSKNDLLRKYLRLGMTVAKKQAAEANDAKVKVVNGRGASAASKETASRTSSAKTAPTMSRARKQAA